MVVYLEYVVIDNLVIDYLLLKISRSFLKLKSNVKNLIVSSIVGTLFTCVLPMLSMSNGYLFVIKFLLGLLMIILSGKFNSVKQTAQCFSVFLAVTFCFGGAVYLVLNSLYGDYKIENILYGNEVLLAVSLVTSFISYYALKKFISYVYFKSKIAPFLCQCVIYVNGNNFKVEAFLDSGNRLRYYKTGEPIIIASKNLKEKIEKDGALDGMEWDYVTYNTVSGESKLKIVKIDKIMIYNNQKANIFSNVIMGLSRANFNDREKYDLLLNIELF